MGYSLFYLILVENCCMPNVLREKKTVQNQIHYGKLKINQELHLNSAYCDRTRNDKPQNVSVLYFEMNVCNQSDFGPFILFDSHQPYRSLY